jgi:hypothetical protein
VGVLGLDCSLYILFLFVICSPLLLPSTAEEMCMRSFAVLLLSMVSLNADSLGVNATKVPPVRKNAVARTPFTMKMPTAKSNTKKGTSKPPAQKSGAIARAISAKTAKAGVKAPLLTPSK